MFGDERASAKEISLFFCVTSMSAVSETTKLETRVRMCSHPTSDFLYLVTIRSLATHQILAQLVNRILR